MSESSSSVDEDDNSMMVRIYTDENHLEIFHRVTLRLKVCREAGCFNACWEVVGKEKVLNIRVMSDGKLRKVFIDKCNEDSPIKGAHVAKFAVVMHLWKDLGESSIPGPLLDDRVVMDDVYSYIHHFFFDLCKLRTNSAMSPLTRLEQLEAKLEDLIAINQPDGMTQDSKRQKI